MSAKATPTTNETLLGRVCVGDCAECGATRNIKLNREDLSLAEPEMVAEWGEPGCVYRYCRECYTNQATILLH